MRTVIAYNAARLGLFLAVAGVLFLLGARGLLLFGAAVVVSGLISFVLLSAQRDAMSAALYERTRRARGRMAQAQAREDIDDGPSSGDEGPARTGGEERPTGDEGPAGGDEGTASGR